MEYKLSESLPPEDESSMKQKQLYMKKSEHMPRPPAYALDITPYPPAELPGASKKRSKSKKLSQLDRNIKHQI